MDIEELLKGPGGFWIVPLFGGGKKGREKQAGRMAPSLLLHSDLCRFVAGF